MFYDLMLSCNVTFQWLKNTDRKPLLAAVEKMKEGNIIFHAIPHLKSYYVEWELFLLLFIYLFNGKFCSVCFCICFARFDSFLLFADSFLLFASLLTCFIEISLQNWCFLASYPFFLQQLQALYQTSAYLQSSMMVHLPRALGRKLMGKGKIII